jgi:hypothetical protein
MSQQDCRNRGGAAGQPPRSAQKFKGHAGRLAPPVLGVDPYVVGRLSKARHLTGGPSGALYRHGAHRTGIEASAAEVTPFVNHHALVAGGKRAKRAGTYA